jgi:hypothetical protein
MNFKLLGLAPVKKPLRTKLNFDFLVYLSAKEKNLILENVRSMVQPKLKENIKYCYQEITIEAL